MCFLVHYWYRSAVGLKVVCFSEHRSLKDLVEGLEHFCHRLEPSLYSGLRQVYAKMEVFLMLTIVWKIIEELIKHNLGYQAEARKSLGDGNDRGRSDNYAWLSFRR